MTDSALNGLRTNHTSNFTRARAQLQYPYIFIPKYGNEIALLVQDIQQGSLPIVLSHGNSLRKVGSCSLSAIELAKLLRVYKYEIVLAEDDRRKITSVQNIMEVLSWMVL